MAPWLVSGRSARRLLARLESGVVVPGEAQGLRDHAAHRLDVAIMRGGIVVLALVAGLTDSVSAQPRPNLIGNPSFEEGTAAGPPQRWALYGTLTQTRRLSLVDEARDGRRALLIDDADSTGEIGVSQTVAARGELGYRASVWVRGLEASSPIGAYLQMLSLIHISEPTRPY